MLERLLTSDRRLWGAALAICLVVLGATAHWYGLSHIDTQAADWGAWQLAHHGTFHLEGLRELPDNRFFIEADGHTVAGRTAGVVLIGVPFQLLLAPLHAAPETAGALAGVVITSLGLANCALLARRLGADRRVALAAALVLGTGTPVWTVAGAELWTHGPDLLWMSLAFLAAERGGWLRCGLAFSAALWTRPHLALIAAFLALIVSWARRDARPAAVVGACTGLALLALMGWNAVVFGEPSIGGGAYTYAVGRVSETSGAAASSWLRNIAWGTVSPLRGFVLYSPVVLPALWVAARSWRRAPDWTRGAIVGGLVYLLAQWRVNEYMGGTNFFGNRLVIEALVAGFPLCAWAYADARPTGRPRLAVRLAAALSIATHMTGALLAYAPPNSFDTRGGAWRHWLLLQDVRSLHGIGWSVAAAAFLPALVIAVWPAMIRGRLTRGSHVDHRAPVHEPGMT